MVRQAKHRLTNAQGEALNALGQDTLIVGWDEGEEESTIIVLTPRRKILLMDVNGNTSSPGGDAQ